MLNPECYETVPDEKLVLLAQQNRQAMESLILRYTGFVWNQVRQFQGQTEAEDLAQEGFLGLISAVCRYDPKRGASFSAFAMRCITNHMISALRRCRNLPLPVGASDVPPLSQVEDPADLPDFAAQSRIQSTAMICTMVSRLSRREYQVCMLIYSGLSYEQAAQKLNISVKSVDNALQRARRKLRAAAGEPM